MLGHPFWSQLLSNDTVETKGDVLHLVSIESFPEGVQRILSP